MEAPQSDVEPIPPEPKPKLTPTIREPGSPEFIRLTPPATFSALVREIASRSAH